MAAVIKAGTQTGAGTVKFQRASGEIQMHTTCIKLMATSAAVVKINGESVTLPVNTLYTDFCVDATEIEVVSGNINYVAIG